MPHPSLIPLTTSNGPTAGARRALAPLLPRTPLNLKEKEEKKRTKQEE
jgi:hypothetical protein